MAFGLIQPISASTLIDSFRAGRRDRLHEEDARRKSLKDQRELENDRRADDALSRAFSRRGGGVQAQFGIPETGGVASLYAVGRNENAPHASRAVDEGVLPEPRNFSEAFDPASMEQIARGPASPANANHENEPIAPAEVYGGASGAPAERTGSQVPPIDYDALFEFMRLKPQQGQQILAAVKTMNETQIKAAEVRNEAFGAAARYIRVKQVGSRLVLTSAEERRERLEHAADHLRTAGLSDAQIAGADLSDAGLEAYERMSAGYDNMILAETRQRRLENGIEDNDADNARADRNTDSLVASRAGRLAEARTNNARTDSTRRRGQDLRPTPEPRAAGKAGTVGNPVSVTTPTQAQALKAGTYYRTPDGKVKIR